MLTIQQNISDIEKKLVVLSQVTPSICVIKQLMIYLTLKYTLFFLNTQII